MTLISNLKLKLRRKVNIRPSFETFKSNTCHFVKDKGDIDFSQVRTVNLDEYVGLDKNHPQSFGKYLYDHVFGKVNFKSVKYISDYGESYSEILEKEHILLGDDKKRGRKLCEERVDKG